MVALRCKADDDGQARGRVGLQTGSGRWRRMELRDALTQITEIRQQMARTQVFRGYRALPVAFSGILAFAAAGFQAVWIPDPTGQVSAYLNVWIGTAVISALAAGMEMVAHARNSQTAWSREITWLAIEQFLPCM